jgi:ribosomal protein S18 acetylase RimI-like enzyme
MTSYAPPGQETLIESWRMLARISPGARLIRSPVAAAAVFPAWASLNNAILLEVPDDGDASAAASALKGVYVDAGVDAWALWLPSLAIDLNAPDLMGDLGGFKRDTTTLVMQATLQSGLRFHDGVARTSIATATRAGEQPVAIADLGHPDEVPGLAAWVMVRDDVAVAGAWSCLHDSDCGIYTVGTSRPWRRRGLARALVEHILADAHRQGTGTATLQTTRMARRLYESLGFEPAGRYEEWISQ